MWAMFANGATEENQCSHFFAAAVAVVIVNLIKRAALWSISHRIHSVTQRQNPLHILKLRTERRNCFERPIFVGIANQLKRPVLLRSEDVAVGVKGHRDQRASLLIGDKPLDGKFGIHEKPRSFVGNNDLIAPWKHATEWPVNFR